MNKRISASRETRRKKIVLASSGRVAGMESPTAIASLFRRIDEEMLPIIRRHTVAVSLGYDKSVRHHGMGTLVRFGDTRLLVTASHVLKGFIAAKSQDAAAALFIDNDDELVRVSGEYSGTDTARDPRSNRHSEHGDDLDVAVWFLDSHTLKKLTKKAFLNRPDISVTADLSKGVYFLAGFPCEWSAVKDRIMHCESFRHVAAPLLETKSFSDFNPELHFALHLDRTGETPEKLQGISGCSIWKLTEGPLTEAWNAGQARVVAVQTGVYPRAIKGTKWGHVLRPLVDKDPSIRECFKLALPGRE